MIQKKFTSWGVSFASLALVAGMMSYMGITNKDKTSQTKTVAQAQTATQTSTDQTSSSNQSLSGHHGNFDTTTGGT